MRLRRILYIIADGSSMLKLFYSFIFSRESKRDFLLRNIRESYRCCSHAAVIVSWTKSKSCSLPVGEGTLEALKLSEQAYRQVLHACIPYLPVCPSCRRCFGFLVYFIHMQHEDKRWKRKKVRKTRKNKKTAISLVGTSSGLCLFIVKFFLRCCCTCFNMYIR